MTVSLELWQLITLLFAVVSAFWAIARLLMAQAQRNIDEKFRGIGEHMKGQDESSRRLERDLMELKAELPRDYVRREDYTQAIATIMTKIDAMTLRVEAMFRDLITKQGVER
jgi:hypothetical protein